MEDWNIELNSQYLGYRNQYPNHPNNQYILMLGLSGIRVNIINIILDLFHIASTGILLFILAIDENYS